MLSPDFETDRTQATLIIPDLDPSEDGGIYRCKARNAWGEVEEEFPVKIHGKSKRRMKLSQ